MEDADAIIEKYDVITNSSNWNSKTVLVNDYEELEGVKLLTADISRISDFHEKIINRLGSGDWYFITSSMLYYGIIRIYASYVNYYAGPTVHPVKRLKDIKDDLIVSTIKRCRISLTKKINEKPRR